MRRTTSDPASASDSMAGHASRAGFELLHEFSGTDGMDPYNQLLMHDGKLYTTAVRGGANGKGTLVSFDLARQTLAALHHFDGANGSSPFNLNAIADDKLWGVTRSDAINHKGMLFSYDAKTGDTEFPHRFTGSPTGGEHTLYGPTAIEGKLYGMSNMGGAHGHGALYCFDPSDRTLELLHSFEGGQGVRPFAGLTLLDGWLIGTVSDITLRRADDPPNTSFGGIFRIRTDGSDYRLMHRFAGGRQGGHPYGNLVADGRGWLYGTTLGEYNNIDDKGVVFRIDTAFHNYEVIHDFAATSGDGSKPNGDIVIAANGQTLYGFTHGSLTAPMGGDSPFFGSSVEAGTLFEMQLDGSDFTVLHRFDSPANGLVPERTPVLLDGVLYGAAAAGGRHRSSDRPDGMGVIFSYTPDPTAAPRA